MEESYTYTATLDLIQLSLLVLLAGAGGYLYRLYRKGHRNPWSYYLLAAGVLPLANIYVRTYVGPVVPDLLVSFGLVLGPLLYFFVRSLGREGQAWEDRFALHILPSALLLPFLARGVFPLGQSLLIGLAVLHFAAYLALSWRYLQQQQAASRRAGTYRHLYHLLGVVFLSFLAVALESWLTAPVFAVEYSILIITCGVVYLLLRKVLLKARRVWRQHRESGEKYKDSVLSREESRQLAKQLAQVMDTEKPYLDDAISLSSLAAELDILPRHLSQVINENYQQNFFEYVNTYRIEEAKRMLQDDRYKDHKIYEIMYEVGFNSRSSFNAAFKKATGRTAGEYRKGFMQKV